MKRIIIILLLVFLNTYIYSQSINENAIGKINNELEKTGISQVLRFRDIVVDTVNHIIRVQFEFNSIDAAQNDTLWRILKLDFRKQKNMDIREYLYFYCINVFKIARPEEVLLEIRQSYINEDCPFIQFYYNEDTKKFTGDEKEKMCMAEYKKALLLNSFVYYDKSFLIQNSEIAIDSYYNALNWHFREFYRKGGFEKNSKQQEFKSMYRKMDPVLKFEVQNLQKEVLNDAGENFVYSILKFIYNKSYLPYEYLKFEIGLVPQKQTNQMELNVKITGRYGSGFYENWRWETMNDMDKGFPAYIDDYARKVSEEIIRKISIYKDYGN